MMDPDNRRPVDFTKRSRLLAEVAAAEHKDRASLLAAMCSEWRDGRIKLYLTWKALAFRRENQQLFSQGSYTPLSTAGKHKASLCAFLRHHANSWVLVAVPVLVTRLAPAGHMPIGGVWGNTQVVLPREAPMKWHNVLTGEMLTLRGRQERKGGVSVRSILRSFPVAVLEASATS
jgi:(1->4)-alpha-D-glucan 1-alpha-D-glucosylmutase